jgi:hypothetical protein
MICCIHNQILAHDGKTDQAHISTGLRQCSPADVDAGETRSTVSQRTTLMSDAIETIQRMTELMDEEMPQQQEPAEDSELTLLDQP